MARLDPHSFADDAQPVVAHLDWHAKVDFDARALACEAVLRLREPGSGPIDLDTRALAFERVTDADGAALRWEPGETHPVLGTPVRVYLPENTREFRIRYRTSPDASALQWLTGAQTDSGEPFVFSQCQAIHARAVIPVQDTPSRRITFTARLEVPAGLRGLMAAGFTGREERGRTAVEAYAMPQPIPPYLFAFAVGRLESRDLGARSRVWAEPSVVEGAAWEFAHVDEMLTAGEALFGPYDWERFDLLVMPRSFPYGGMENPRLTFLTPTLLAKDRSLVNVVAHELAHSWTGNLVTNANAEHFWLNEGWTVFAERRIVEAIEGRDRAELDAAIGRRTLANELERFKDRPELTKLRQHLDGVDPDDAFSSIPYEKGYLFLRRIEEAAGRERFAAFVRRYIETFRFGAITTDDFLALARRELPDVLESIDVGAWVEAPGLPGDAPVAKSDRLAAVERIGARLPRREETAAWSATEWQLYLAALPHPPPAGLCEALDATYGLNASGNMEVLVNWLAAALEAGYAPAVERTREVLASVGRMKYLRPLYKSLLAREETRPVARAAAAENRARYHPIARQVVDGLLKQA